MSTALAPVNENVPGLEDVDATDMRVPRINIDHKNATFVDSLTNEVFPELVGFLLGLVKQRVLWPPEFGTEAADPLCKSQDHNLGRPGKEFPWAASGFDQAAAAGLEGLPCASCALKEWGSHPRFDKPWCTEQYVFPFLRESGPCILTFQSSGIAPCRNYVSAFQGASTPLFTAATKITLKADHRGSVDFAVPVFTKLGPTPEERWEEYAELLRSIRGFLHTPPKAKEDENGTGVPAVVPAPPPSPPTPAEAPIPVEPERVLVTAGAPVDDLPF